MFRRIVVVVAVLGLVVAVAWAAGWLPGRLPDALPRPSGPSASVNVDALARGTVVTVIDGDTLDLRLGGDTVRVRLLNIDAPETGHDDRPAHCLADEAKAELQRLAGKGATVRVASYGIDRFGRTLAGLYDQQGKLLNAELVAAGLAAPFVVNRQVDLIEPVRAAQAEAASARVGLHAERGCTVPGRVRAAEKGVAGLPLAASGRTAQSALAEAKRLDHELAAVAKALRGNERYVPVDGLTDDEVSDLDARVSAARTRLAAITRELQGRG